MVRGPRTDGKPMTEPANATLLKNAVRLSADTVLNPGLHRSMSSDAPALVVLAAGRGTRFGQDPKCIQPVHGIPLARNSIDAFRRCFAAPVICIVGYRHEQVAAALGANVLYVRSDNPAGGTAFAAYEAFSVADLVEANPLLIVTMGDRIVPPAIFQRLWEKHLDGEREADLTFLTARYEPPRNRGKGRVLRDGGGRVLRIVEERDIAAEADQTARHLLLNLTEGNCPLYILHARRLRPLLETLSNANARERQLRPRRRSDDVPRRGCGRRQRL